MLRLLVLFESCSDIIKEYAADDATAPPHAGNGSQIELPSESLGSTLQYSEPLCIGHQFGCIQCRIDVLHHFRLVIYHIRMPTDKMPGCCLTQILLRREAPFKDRRSNQSQRHAQFHSIDHRPFARTLLSGNVQYFVYQETARFIFMLQYVGSDFNEIAAQLALVPIGKDGRHFFIAQFQEILHQPIGLRNKLHITILNAIVNHLDKMTGSSRPHPLATWRSIRCFSGNAL